MTDRELMQQALEALDGLSEPYDVLRIQTALRERLAQPPVKTDASIIDAIADNLLQDHIDLMTENNLLRGRLASWDALERMADNARELGLDYDEPVKEKNT